MWYTVYSLQYMVYGIRHICIVSSIQHIAGTPFPIFISLREHGAALSLRYILYTLDTLPTGEKAPFASFISLRGMGLPSREKGRPSPYSILSIPSTLYARESGAPLAIFTSSRENGAGVPLLYTLHTLYTIHTGEKAPLPLHSFPSLLKREGGRPLFTLYPLYHLCSQS